MEEAINAAIAGQTGTPNPTGQAAPSDPKAAAPQVTQPSGQADTQAPNLEGQEAWEYDGNVTKVPPQFQKFAKGLQRHFTERSMAEAEIRRKGQEFDQFMQSDDYKGYQAWKSSQGQPGQAAPVSQTQNPALISQAEWEEAQLDPSGQKAQALMERVAEARANAIINQAVQVYGGQIQQIQQQQEQTRFNTALSDFADANPDVLELHEMGLMKSRIEEELSSRQHSTYESAIAAATQKAREAREVMRARLLQEQNELVQKKRDAITQSGTSSGEQVMVHVDRGDAFNTAFENALNGKKVKNKLK